MIKAVVFDLDDTLFPELDYVYSGFRSVSYWVEATLGIDSEQAYAEFIRIFNTDRKRVFDIWLGVHGLPPHFKHQMIHVYRNHRPDIRPYDDAVSILRALRERGYLIGLVSDGFLAVQETKFRALDIEAYFDSVVFSDAYGRSAWKPSLFPFSRVLRELDIKPSEAVYVADNPQKDFIAPNLMGMRSVRIVRPDGLYAHLKPAGEIEQPAWVLRKLYKDLLFLVEGE